MVDLSLVELFEKFGLPVVFLAIMIYLFIRAEEKFNDERKNHRDERSEWRSSQTRLQKDTNEALKDLTNAIIHLERGKK